MLVLNSIDTSLPSLPRWMALSGSRRRRHLNALPAASRKSGNSRTHVPAGTWRVEWKSLYYVPLIAESRGTGFRSPTSVLPASSGKTERAFTYSGNMRIPPSPLHITSPPLSSPPPAWEHQIIVCRVPGLRPASRPATTCPRPTGGNISTTPHPPTPPPPGGSTDLITHLN